jgi:hypothetical protein
MLLLKGQLGITDLGGWLGRLGNWLPVTTHGRRYGELCWNFAGGVREVENAEDFLQGRTQ